MRKGLRLEAPKIWKGKSFTASSSSFNIWNYSKRTTGMCLKPPRSLTTRCVMLSGLWRLNTFLMASHTTKKAFKSYQELSIVKMGSFVNYATKSTFSDCLLISLCKICHAVLFTLALPKVYQQILWLVNSEKRRVDPNNFFCSSFPSERLDLLFNMLMLMVLSNSCMTDVILTTSYQLHFFFLSFWKMQKMNSKNF